ncbi:hypothetical protein AQUSIP_22240 [Aquicella siphonis]|uniref:Uncharacterized protein n=1 Tax=Aquicella siphonis TaxID=254247 RepID=A0A5E4PKG0_9COXI|nr:hypothetical protein AQUSIP_22240 [Aquicella siphonis]
MSVLILSGQTRRRQSWKISVPAGEHQVIRQVNQIITTQKKIFKSYLYLKHIHRKPINEVGYGADKTSTGSCFG